MTMIRIDGNWKTFKETDDNDRIILLHATSVDNAKNIFANGFNTNNKLWTDSEDGYIFLAGTRYSLGTYLRHNQNAIIEVSVKKSDVKPDSKSGDWKQFARLNKNELKRDGVDSENPTAFDTFKYIGQVKADIRDVTFVKWYSV